MGVAVDLRKLSKDQKVLYKASFINELGDLTPEGTEVLKAVMLEANIKQMLAEASSYLKARKAEDA